MGIEKKKRFMWLFNKKKKKCERFTNCAITTPGDSNTCPRACMFERCVCVGLGAHTDVSYQTVRRLRSLLWQCKSKQSRWRNARCKRKSSETTNNLNVSLSSLAFLTNYSHMQHAHTLKLTEDKETDSNNARAPPLQLLCNFTARRGEKKKKKKERVPFLILLVLGVLTENSPMPLYLQSCAE